MAKKKKKAEESGSDSDSGDSSSSSSNSSSSSSSSDSDSDSDSSKESKKKKKKGGKADKKGKKSKKEKKEGSKGSSSSSGVKEVAGEPVAAPKVKKYKLKQRAGRRSRNIRKRPTELGDSDSETGEALHTTLEIQRLRRRGGGVGFAEEGDGEAGDKTDGGELASVVHGSSEGGLVQKGIDKAFKTEVSDHVLVNQQMEEYIQQKINEKNNRARKEEEEEVVREKTAEEELYEIPDFLRYDAEEVGESGDRWLAGIQEVELPISVKLANIERTELEKQKMLKEKAAKKKEYRYLPTNQSTNYLKHKNDFKKKMQEQRMREEMEKEKGGEEESDKYKQARDKGRDKVLPPAKIQKKGIAAYNIPSGGMHSKRASDDKAMDRFIKRYKH